MNAGLREPGAVLLVSCYELGHQPLALASPAAFLRRAGYCPRLLDLTVDPLDEAAMHQARFVGIAVQMHTALRLGVEAATRVREINPGAFVCFYGLYASLNAEYLLAGPGDAVLAGEAEEALVDMVRGVDAGEVRGRSPLPVLERLSFPVPARQELPELARYAHLERGESRVTAGYVEASRGCLHLCRHCPIPPVYGGRFFVVPRPVVLADARQQIQAGARHITFGDPDFLNGPGHGLAVARELHAAFPRVTFDVTTKVEHILKHRDAFPELASLGCLFVVSAVESLSDVVLAHLDKGHTRADVAEALRVTRAAGIALRPSLVPFTPWTTAADYLALFAWIAAEGLAGQVDPVQLTIRLLIPPGSLLLDLPALQPRLGPLDAATFSYRWTHPDPRMDLLQRQAADLVATAARDAAPPAESLQQLWALATSHLDGPPGELTFAGAGISPHLSEPWFC